MLGRFRWSFRGKDSDIEFADELSFSSRRNGDRVVEIRYFRDHDEARAHFEG